MSLPHFRRW